MTFFTNHNTQRVELDYNYHKMSGFNKLINTGLTNCGKFSKYNFGVNGVANFPRKL